MFDKQVMVSEADAIVGGDSVMPLDCQHSVFQCSLKPPFAQGLQQVQFGLGCFWGAERLFWQTAGVKMTAVGYSAGFTKNPSYEQVCTGQTGHNEVVLVVFDPKQISFNELLAVFWQAHNPTQLMRQGNDIGTQYRSGIYCSSDEQLEQALASKALYQEALTANNIGDIVTEVLPAQTFYYAECYHQQYLYKNPLGYCGLAGCGVQFPI